MKEVRKNLRVTAAAFACAAVSMSIAHSAVAQTRTYAVEPVAVTGEPAPGTGGLSFEWVAISDFNLSLSGGLINPYLNDSGVVVFKGSTYPDDPNTVDEEAIWVGVPGNLTLVASTGDLVPGGFTHTFGRFISTQLNEAGDLAIHAHTVDGDSFGDGIWVGPVGSLSRLAMSGDPAPDTDGPTFLEMYLGSLDDLGSVSFFAYTSLDPASPDFVTGIWAGTPGLVSSVVKTGDPAPGTGGQAFSFIGGPLSENADTKTFSGTIVHPDLSRTEGLWTTGPAGSDLIALQGDEAPGTGGGSFKEFSGPVTSPQIVGEPFAYAVVWPVINPAGDLVFGAYLVDPADPINGRGDHGIWIKDTLGLQLLALTGDPAPGTASAPFHEFNHINFNAQGLMAFDASLDIADPDRDHGIWLGPPESPALVVREGDAAPGAAGETFGSLIMGPNLNDSSEIVFSARLRESGTDGAWAGTPGDLALILREGEAIEVKPGDHRIVESVAFFEGGFDVFSQGRNFNNAGQLVFFVTFTDGSKGLLLASPITGTTNQPPVANAGPDLTIWEAQSITLDGSGSTDPEKTVLSFVWSVNSAEVATGPTATVGGLAPGTHTVTLTVTDRSGASASDDMVLTVEPNLPPVANAGPDQTVTDLEAVTFDGSGSSDPEGSALSYSWSIAGIEFATGPSPTAGPFVPGTHTVTLTVADHAGVSATDTMLLTVTNVPPVANAGPDQTVQTLATVGLDGTASFDPEAGPLTYAWSLGGVQIATGPTPVVGPFDAGVHTITLTVTDNYGATASDEMLLTALNRAPTADAGPDQTANYAETVTLNGAGSTDPEGGVLSYAWSIGGIQIATRANPAVGPFEIGIHTVSLTVTDDHGATATDSVIITVVNDAPVANAGPDQAVSVRGKTTTVTLDGTASADPEGGVLSYLWTRDGQTVGTGAVVPLELGAGVHVFTLTVTDDHGATASDSVVVTATKGGKGA